MEFVLVFSNLVLIIAVFTGSETQAQQVGYRERREVYICAPIGFLLLFLHQAM